MTSVIEVRLVRVDNKPQRYAAYAVDGGNLLGYCGRDGVITHPVDDVQIGQRTVVLIVEDVRAPKKGLQRTLARVERMLNKDTLDVRSSDTPWKEIGRKELGLYASGHVSGPGWSNRGYICIVFEVSEVRTLSVKDEKGEWRRGSLTEYRTRTENGPACRMHREGYDAFVNLYKQYAAHARQHIDGMHTEKHLECYHQEELGMRRAAPSSKRPRATASTKKRIKTVRKRASAK